MVAAEVAAIAVATTLWLWLCLRKSRLRHYGLAGGELLAPESTFRALSGGQRLCFMTYFVGLVSAL